MTYIAKANTVCQEIQDVVLDILEKKGWVLCSSIDKRFFYPWVILLDNGSVTRLTGDGSHIKEMDLEEFLEVPVPSRPVQVYFDGRYNPVHINDHGGIRIGCCRIDYSIVRKIWNHVCDKRKETIKNDPTR